MILDKVLNGVLDQGNGCLIVFDEPEEDLAYPMAIQTIGQVGKVVEALYAKVCFSRLEVQAGTNGCGRRSRLHEVEASECTLYSDSVSN